jgi:hypothetical protein
MVTVRQEIRLRRGLKLHLDDGASASERRRRRRVAWQSRANYDRLKSAFRHAVSGPPKPDDPPLRDKPEPPIHDPPVDPTQEPEQPFGDPTPLPGNDPPDPPMKA